MTAKAPPERPSAIRRDQAASAQQALALGGGRAPALQALAEAPALQAFRDHAASVQRVLALGGGQAPALQAFPHHAASVRHAVALSAAGAGERAVVAGLATLLLSGCVGMKLNESAVRDRAEKTRPREPGVVDITPPLLEKLREEQRKLASAPAVDPLVAEAATYEYRIAPFDIIGVTVWDHPELTIPAGEFRTPESTGNPVRADGTMFYPHAGVLSVAGKTVSEVRELLTQKLTRVIQKPQLDVRVVQFRAKKVQVTGEVVAPATIPITDVPMRVQDALAQAKGLTPEADLSRVALTRRGKVYELDLQALYERGDASQNWLLADGDVVNVPDRSRNKVFVLGEVKNQASRLMVKGRMTLAEAVGDLAAIDQSTTSNVIYVIRGEFERPRVYRLDASSPDALLLAVQFPMQPADVVFVSASELTRWSRVVAHLLPTIQGLWQGLNSYYIIRTIK